MKHSVYFCFALFLCACNNVFEEDIASSFPLLLAPVNGDTITASQVGFSWEGLDGADQYEFRLYELPGNLIVDSVADDSYILVSDLGSGLYRWQLRAINSAYQSQWATADFALISDSLDIDISLVAPDTGLYSSRKLNFEWTKSQFISEYVLFIFTSGGIIQDTLNTNKASIEFPDLDEAITWKVLGFTDDGDIYTSDEGSFRLDLIAPDAPILKNQEDTIRQNSLKLVWDRFSEDIVQDSIIILTPIDSSVVTTDLDDYTVYNNLKFTLASSVKQNSLEFDNLNDFGITSGKVTTLYWTVVSYDKVGHASPYGTIKKLIFKLETAQVE